MLGPASFSFLSGPAKMTTLEFVGLAFVIVALSVYWGRWMNDLA